MDASHWIGSVRFELRSSDSAALEPLRRALRDGGESILMRPLQRAFDRHDRPWRVARHRRIEIDLGRIEPSALGEILERRVAEAMRLELEPAGPAGRGRGPGPGLDEEDQLVAFLETGLLAWPSPGKALETICRALVQREDRSLARLAGQLKLLFGKRPEAAVRFARQCPLGLVARIAILLSGADELPGTAVERGEGHAEEAMVAPIAALILRLARGAVLSAQERRWLAALFAGGGAAGRVPGAKGRAVAHPLSPAPDGAQPARPQATLAGPLEEWAGGREGREAALPHHLPLEAAGLVLIHPFVAGLFGACGLLDGQGRFLGEAEQARAVLLLQFAATGEREVAEPELALAKLLTGLDLGAPVPRRIEPSAAEQSEIEQLLAAAIAHWGALGDSSAEALRDTFLRRPGRLEGRGEGWRLVVEQRGVDMLLDRLPWALGIVMTPFMTRPLPVEWR